MRWIVWIFLMAVVVLGSLLIASRVKLEAGARFSGGSSRSYSAPSRPSYSAPSRPSYSAPSYSRPSYSPPPRSYSAPAYVPPRRYTTTINRTTVIYSRPQVTVQRGGGWFGNVMGSFVGSMGGTAFANWMWPPKPVEQQPANLCPAGDKPVKADDGSIACVPVPATPPPASAQSGQSVAPMPLQQQLQQQIPGALPGTTSLPGNLIKVQ